MILINGVPFEPHPDIGFKSDKEHKPIEYAYHYIRIAEDIEKGVIPQADTFRTLIQKDLWFLLYFVVKPFADNAGRAMANHPFVVSACQEIENGPKDYTLDVWAREHFKSSILTIAETIQYQLCNPEYATGIFSYVAPKAKDFLFSIKSIFEREQLLKVCFPDVVWNDCRKEAPLWSMDEGIILKRKSNRQEPSIGAYGLVEGMPTGMHFERRVYDDIVTEDIGSSFDTMEKVKIKFDSSQNIGKDGGHHRVIGTFYHHSDPLVHVRDIKGMEGKPAYHFRLKAGSEDGTATGKPILVSQERWNNLKLTSTFACQQLCDPTPETDQRLNPDYLNEIDYKMIPRNIHRFMIIDQAGDAPSNKTTRDADSWAIGVIAIEPAVDNIGLSRRFIENLWVSPASESEAIDQAVRMFLMGGMIERLGVEYVGLSTTHIHIANALKAKGRYVTFGELKENYVGILLRPAGRNKKKFIEGAVGWPLNNGKWFYSRAIPSPYIERLKQEMTNFPLWHDDALNLLAYTDDILKNCHFAVGWNQDFNRPLKLATCPI